MLTDGQGMPLALAIDGANWHDMKLVRKTLENLPWGRPRPTARWPQHLCMDKGYDFREVRDLVAEFGLTAQICSRNEEAKAIRSQVGYRARRSVGERSHSWINRCRGLLVRWAKKAENYLAFLHLACGIITWRASGLLG